MAQFSFSAVVCNQNKSFTFDVPTNNQGVITNRFCPKAFLVPKNGLYDAVTPINGETVSEFEQDCCNLANAITNSIYKNSNNKWDIYMDALASIVEMHTNRCGRLLFNDLLIYIDIFSYFLFADGINEENIKANYPRFTYQFLIKIPNYLKDSVTLQPLTTSYMASVIKNLNYKAEVELGLSFPKNSAESINTLISKAYNLIMQHCIKNEALSSNGFPKELLQYIDIVPFKNIEDIISKVMEHKTVLNEKISNPIQAATVFWFIEDLCRTKRLAPFISICNWDMLSYYYAYHAMQVVYKTDKWGNVDSWRYIMIKVLIRYFSRFYELVDANANMLLQNNKRYNAEEDIDKFLDFLLISLIKSSDDTFFSAHTDLIEVRDICQQKIDMKYKDESICSLIKGGEENQYKLFLAIEDYYCLLFSQTT